MKIALGADHRGVESLEHVIQTLEKLDHEVVVMRRGQGASAVDYPDIAYPVAVAVAQGVVDRGILMCGSGIGMCIAANKVRGVRAALVHDEVGADVSRRHNDANVLCLPADMLGVRFIDRIVQTWLKVDFEGGRHTRRLTKVAAIEQGRDPATVGDAFVGGENAIPPLGARPAGPAGAGGCK
jgi:ribose 5-phosphate isomerase B